MRLPINTKKQIVKLAIKDRVSVSKLSKEYKVARKTIYAWIKIYNSAALRNKKTALREKYVSGKNHPKYLQNTFTDKVIRIVKKNPALSVSSISKALKVGRHAVYNALKALELTTEDSRLAFSRIYEFPGILDSSIKLSVVQSAINKEKSITFLAKENNVARKTIYSWINEFRAEGNVNLDYVSGFAHPRAYSQDRVEEILNAVCQNPEFSIHTLANNLGLSVHGVYNVLQRNMLTHAGERFAFAKVHGSLEAKKPVFGFFTSKIKSLLSFMSPNMLPAPPPEEKMSSSSVSLLKQALAVFLTTSTLTFISVYVSNIVFSGVTNPGKVIGLVFACIALALGSFFFLYSLKYYLSLAIVLSYSQKETGNYHERKRGKGILSWILGDANVSGFNWRQGKVVGLKPNLDNIHIRKHPFVSVHIPFYNEKNVVRRSIDAVVNLNYPSYEVILCDDSTDETTNIIHEYQESVLLKGEKLHVVKGDGWQLTSVEVKPGVTLKHLHRTTRHGFKGAALELARTLVNPKTEFISIFDADFVPYPDSLELFLKYFKVQNNMSEDYVKSNVAAVQGYQWHVLNKSENWITRGVRSEYAGSYVVERSGIEIYGGLKQISGSVYMIRRDVLDEIKWGTSITEDFELTLRLYEAGYKVLYTPYIQAPAECVSTIRRFVRQRMRWAEGHSFNVKKMFKSLMVSPKLTVPEKLEFAYLSPYYLQAFFFLAGTLSWLISETIFQVRLPFWTELWGWSLVLSNMISLPLVNLVGMFLEESGEKDYMGIGSFVALCYLVVPFQAYAAVKGFFEREEGTWFRTPKTGRVTDVLTRNKFYRFIQGIIPGKENVANFENKPSPYLSLSTANNRFDQFSVATKKGRRWIGKLMLVILLITSNLLLTMAPSVPYIIKPHVTEARGFGIVGKSASTSGENMTAENSITATNEVSVNKSSEPIVSSNQKVSVITKTLSELFYKFKAFVNRLFGFFHKPSETFDKSINLDQNPREDIKKVEISETGNETIDFSGSQSPEFSLKLADPKYKNIQSVSANVVHSAGSLPSFDPQINIDSVSQEVIFTAQKPDNFRPGLYTLEASIQTQSGVVNIKQDFTWGVLAINTDKSVYKVGDTANLGMAVLDDNGLTKCQTPDDPFTNARLWLSVTSPAGKVTNYSTDDGTIKGSGQCAIHSVTNTADFLATYEIKETGTHLMHLKAENINGTRLLDDTFEVTKSPSFEITRNAPTRIYPVSDYTNTITIKSHQKFSGIIREYLPLGFEVLDENPEYKVSKTDNKLVLEWATEIKNGETKTISYKFIAPIISPEFYLLGPLQIGNIFTEARTWQIASDATQAYTSGTGTWTAPVTGNVSLELHGGGGGGGRGGGTNKYGGGGGAGGQAVVNSSVAVTKNTGYSYAVGAAGGGGISTHVDGYVGGDTTLAIGATTYTAKGGAYGQGYASGYAKGVGSTTGGVAGTGGTVYKGGDGYNGSAGSGSGAGGGGAGSTGNGKSATGYGANPGGTTANNGGNGGNGTTSSAVAGSSPTTAYGGGGGGGTKNANGGAGYAGYILITYTADAPTVTTEDVGSISTTTATGNGTVTDLGGGTLTEKGVCWNTTGTPTTSDSKATATGMTTGAYTVSMTSLSAGTFYYVRAYAINESGTSYGGQVTFTTQATPSVELNTPSSGGSVSTTTPDLKFTGTDVNSDVIRYNIQIDTANTFDSQTGSPLMDKVSGTDSGFSDGSNTDLFSSGTQVTYTVQSALSSGTTYYWRVRGIDPSGSNTYGSWSSTYNFTVSTGPNSTATAFSFQRKTWYDGTYYWKTYTTDTQIQFWYSSDGSTWLQNSSASISITGSDFSIEADNSNAFIVYTTSNDIRGRVASSGTSYPSSSFTWGGEQVIFNGTGATSDYSYPVVARDSSNYVWVGARFTGSSVYYFKTMKETSATNDLPEDSGDTVYSVGDTTNSNSNAYGNIVSLGSQNMYATFTYNTSLKGCKWVNSSTAWQDSNGVSCGGGSGWYNSSWSYRVKLTLDHSKLTADLTDFPVYVDLSNMPSGFHSHVNQTDGRDIRVTKSDGTTEVPREVVYYDSTNDKGELHFKAAGTLSSSSDTDFYIYYGNASASDYAANATYGANNVWDSYASARYSMKDLTTSTIEDSSSNSHDGTKTAAGEPAEADAKIGKGQNLDGSNDYVGTGFYSASDSSFTYSAWFKADTLSDGYHEIIGNENIQGAPDVRGASLRIYSSGIIFGFIADSSGNQNFVYMNAGYTTGTWYHVALTYDYANSLAKLYVDGVFNNTGGDSKTITGFYGNTTANIGIGRQHWGQYYFDGLIDEVRVDSTPRSAAWIGAQYSNESAPSSFFNSWGSEVANTSTDTIATVATGTSKAISSLSDSSGYVHLVYIDSSNNMVYKKYTTSWQTAVTLDSGSSNIYPTISLDTSDNSLYAFWINSNTIYYKRGVSPYASGDWDGSATSWQTGTNLVNLTSNVSGNAKVFAEWTSGASSPYTVNWAMIAIPERLWLIFSLGLIVPLRLKRKKEKGIYRTK